MTGRRILITGSRKYPNLSDVTRAILELELTDVVIHGGAPGVDEEADRAAKRRGIQRIIYPAPWERADVPSGAPGPMRNSFMLKDSDPDEVWAFWDGKSRGTQDMTRKAESAGYNVRIFRADT